MSDHAWLERLALVIEHVSLLVGYHTKRRIGSSFLFKSLSIFWTLTLVAMLSSSFIFGYASSLCISTLIGILVTAR